MDKHESPATAAEGGPYQGAGGVDDDGSSDDLNSCWPREQLSDQLEFSSIPNDQSRRSMENGTTAIIDFSFPFQI